MRQLQFGSKKVAVRHSVMHTFFRAGAVLLAPLIFSCSEPESPKQTSPQPEQVIAGKYKCSPPRFIRGIPPPGLIPAESYLHVTEKNGAVFFTDYTGYVTPLKLTDSGFVFTNRSGGTKVTGIAKFSENATMSLRIIRSSALYNFTQVHQCQCVKKDTDKKFMKAVFIRPCEGQLFATGAFASKAPKTAVGGGTVQSVCTDLSKSGVTDVFLPFKVDHEGKGCGNYGELLYNSILYDTNESQCFKEAFKRGFDPIKSFIKICDSTYQKAGKTIRFHAWFPVFADRRAAKTAGQKAYVQHGFIGNAIDWVLNLFKEKKHNYASPKFADPTDTNVVNYELALLTEIVRKYPVLNGINLDYIRYSDERQVSEDTSVVWDVRPEAITAFVKKVRTAFPNMTLSADVKASAVARQGVGQDGILQYLDVVMPMEYTPIWVNSADVGRWIEEIRSSNPKISILPILRGWVIEQQTEGGLLADLRVDIQSTKVAKSNGYAIFTYESLLRESGSGTLNSIKDKIDY